MSSKKNYPSTKSKSAGKSTPKKYSAAPRAEVAQAAVAVAIPAVATPQAVESPVAVEVVALVEAPVAVVTSAVAEMPADTETAVAVLSPAAKTTAAVAEMPAAEATVAADEVAEATPADETISEVPTMIDVTTLVSALNDASADVACDAAIALGNAGNPSAVGPLVAVVDNRDGYYHSVVRSAAAASLGQLGDAWAVPALVDAIRDPMAEASAEAVRALGALGDARAVPALVEVARNADGFFLPFVRRAAVLALAKLGGPEATATLSAVAGDDYEDAVVRQAAIVSIG